MNKATGSRVLLLKGVIILFYTAAIACASLAATPTFTPTGTPVVSSVWRVNAGGPLYPDSWGNTWTADTNFNSGTARCVTNTVTNTGDSALYQCERYGNPFTYTFNMPAGSYQVTLKFAELYQTAAGARVFDVTINGALVLNDYDIFTDTGAEFSAVSKVFDNISPVSGKITIQFGPASADNAQVCAIQINPQPATPTRTRTVALMPTPTRTPCTPTTITPYIQVGSGIWQMSSSVIVSQGSVVNLGPQPLTGGTWSWTGPAGFTSSSREVSNVPLVLGGNIYTVVHTNSCGGQSFQDFTVTLLAPAAGETVAACASGIVIDGNMNESSWASAVPNPVTKLCMGTNPYSISGEFRTLWDTSSLYVGLSVNDAYLNATQSACATYNNSAVEIYLDMANDGGTQPFPGSVGDFQLMISYDCVSFCMNATVALPPAGMQYASVYNASGYTMEVKLPWAMLGAVLDVVPLIGDTYQFDVQVDFNNGTSERVGQLVWNGDANNWKSSANFGDVLLGYCPSPTPTATATPPALAESYYVFPNPVNPKQSPARFKYYIAGDFEISINIFTVNGNPVRTVLDKSLKLSGYHSEDTWDAKNETGHEVISGVYLCVMSVNDKAAGRTTRLVRKLAVLR